MDVATHPNFRSLDPCVRNARTMDSILEEALSHQNIFVKRTTPWEAKLRDFATLQSFRIKLEMIDRLYYIRYRDNLSDGKEFKMIARVEHEDAPLYVELIANCHRRGFDTVGGGFIFVSRDAILFMKVVLGEGYHEDVDVSLIYKSLSKDEIYAGKGEEKKEESRSPTPTTLQILCHETVRRNEERLRGFMKLMPKLLAQSLNEYIARRAYFDECLCVRDVYRICARYNLRCKFSLSEILIFYPHQL